MRLCVWPPFWGFAFFFSVVADSGVPESFTRYYTSIRDLYTGPGPVTSDQVRHFNLYAQYAAMSYCNSKARAGAAVSCVADVCPMVMAANATVVATFSGQITDIEGVVATDDVNRLIVASFRGSESIRNWITNFGFAKTFCTLRLGCKVHEGFESGYLEIATSLSEGLDAARAAYPDYKLLFTGHSLGGAMATLAAAYQRRRSTNSTNNSSSSSSSFFNDTTILTPIDLYTYGSPRVGNRVFADLVTRQSGEGGGGENNRLTHAADPVPRLPPLFIGYRHVSPEYWVATSGSDSETFRAEDIRVCEGYANLACNGGTMGLDLVAHVFYFLRISACAPSGGLLPWRRRGRRGVGLDVGIRGRDGDGDAGNMGVGDALNMTDAQLEAKLNDFVGQDLEYAAKLGDIWG